MLPDMLADRFGEPVRHAVDQIMAIPVVHQFLRIPLELAAAAPGLTKLVVYVVAGVLCYAMLLALLGIGVLGTLDEIRDGLRWLADVPKWAGSILSAPLRPRLRRNHALEHGTINVVYERSAVLHPVVTGHSYPHGFYISWNLQADRERELKDIYLECAREAVQRLRAGERHLAFSPSCGTVQVVSHLLPGIAFVLSMYLTRGDYYLVCLAVWAAGLLGPVLGWEAQRITLTPEIADVEPVGVEVHPSGHVFIRTAEGPLPEPPGFMPSRELVPKLQPMGGFRMGQAPLRWWWDRPLRKLKRQLGLEG